MRCGYEPRPGGASGRGARSDPDPGGGLEAVQDLDIVATLELRRVGHRQGAHATPEVRQGLEALDLHPCLDTRADPAQGGYLHNRSGGSADNINQTYTVNLSSEALNGTWRLRVRDRARTDTGYINSWSITF